MKYYLYITLFIFNNAFAIGTFTRVESNVSLYSEYYPNPKPDFNGTIIFENGSGTSINEWKQNQVFFNCVKKIGSVFLYDRNGLGKSPPDLRVSSDNPITGKFISDKLSTLLSKQNIKPPYIIVAHSYGSIYAGYFALKKPKLIKAILLVDPVPKEFNFNDKLINDYESAIEMAKTNPSSAVYQKIGGQRAEVTYQLIGFQKAKQQVASLGGIKANIPIIIISSTQMEKDKPLQEDWYSSQKQWLNNNSKSKIITVDAGHFIQLTKPEMVCKQIKVLLDKK